MNAETKNNDNKKNMSSLTKKLKYGSVAMAFTVVFIAVIFILNIVTTSIHKVRPMILDMTEEQLYGFSDATRELLKDITDPIEIVFCTPIDQYEKMGGGVGAMIVNCIKAYTSEYPNITIRTIDLIKNPRAGNEFKTSEASSLSTTSIIVTSGSSSRILSYASFLTIAESDNSIMGFRGELQLTSAILQVTATDSPVVHFTTGHGETTATALEELFRNAGFTIKPIDLTKEEIDPDAKIIVICNPVNDFIGAASGMEKSEVDKIAAFLNKFGNVMYFTSPQVRALPEIEDLLKEYGIAFEHDAIVYDPDKALDTNGLAIDVQYVDSGNVGDQLTDSIKKLPSLPKTISYSTKPIKILDNVSENTVSPVLRSHDTAYIVDSNNNPISQGAIDLFVLAQKTQYIDNNPKTALLLVSGSTEFLNPSILGNPSYSNSDIILNAIRIMANRKVPVEIKWKELDNKSLIITLEDQNRWTLISILLMPSIVIVAGAAVWLKRRHS